MTPNESLSRSILDKLKTEFKTYEPGQDGHSDVCIFLTLSRREDGTSFNEGGFVSAKAADIVNILRHTCEKSSIFKMALFQTAKSLIE